MPFNLNIWHHSSSPLPLHSFSYVSRIFFWYLTLQCTGLPTKEETLRQMYKFLSANFPVVLNFLLTFITPLYLRIQTALLLRRRQFTAVTALPFLCLAKSEFLISMNFLLYIKTIRWFCLSKITPPQNPPSPIPRWPFPQFLWFTQSKSPPP